MAAWLLLPRIAMAQATTYFFERPAWLAVEDQQTTSVALGDMDGDGDLDLVCGAIAVGAYVHRNIGGTFTAAPIWTSERPDSTWSVALGDVDGDGDLDLVAGNHGRTKLYKNRGGVLDATPTWISDRDANTHAVALADIDADGRIDLVCGNFGQSAAYRNVGGIFGDTPFWASRSPATTSSIALGDVNGDHRIDLACGNAGEDQLYLGNVLSFQSAAFWISGRLDDTRGAALGDLDGDGLLDLVCGNANVPSTRFLNIGTTFATYPDWLSGSSGTNCVTLGDVDRDGDLDLLCGTSTGTSMLYLNVGGTLAVDAIVVTSQGGSTNAVALGDVDGDGDLDLACGQTGRSSLYLNSQRSFATTPTAFIGLADRTNVAVLGDVDGDGDLDLVSGGSGSPTLYRFDDGHYVAAPWSIGTCVTTDLALGDVDGDGDLDLLSGSGGNCTPAVFLNTGGTFADSVAWAMPDPRVYSGYAGVRVALGDVNHDRTLDLAIGCGAEDGFLLRVYANRQGTFEVDPIWGSVPTRPSSVALEDVDGDGDLDLVCGRINATTVLFVNHDRTFGGSPGWSTARSANTRDVALGDVDGDGDLDLVCGNFEQTTMLYLNDQGTLRATPAWTSGRIHRTESVALVDVDSDGDLDLVCGNRDQPTTIYFNSNGELELHPSWVSDRADATSSIAVGDVDADGDLDLICGNQGQPATFYAGLLAPIFRGDPSSPRNQLPNTDAFLRRARAERSGVNAYEVRVEAVDVESDPAWIVPEWQFRGVPQWVPVDVAGSPGIVGPIATSPTGSSLSFSWDTSRMPVDPRPVVLRLRTISHALRGGVQQHVSSFLLEVGPIDVRRPMIAVSPPQVTFPAVTVGDTVTTSLEIANRGNELLTVHEIRLPLSPIELEANIPLVLEPGDRTSLTLRYLPRDLPAQLDTLRLESNDPKNPHLGVAVQVEVHPVAFTARLVTALAEVPLGQAVSVILTPATSVRIERAEVHYRPAGSSSAFEIAPMYAVGSEFIGAIPNAGITEGGFEYAFEAENSGVVAIYPQDGSTLFQAVRSPETMIVRPRPNSASGFIDGADIGVEVSLPEGADFVSGVLHYRRGGEALYTADTLGYVAPVASATVPSSFVGARALQYWVELSTATRTLTDPPRNPAGAPNEIRPSVRNLAETAVHPGIRYRLVSVPLEFGAGFTGNLATLLGNEASFGPFDPVRWRAFRYVPAAEKNIELSSSEDPVFRPEPGRAFWLISRSPHAVDTAPAADARATSAGAPYSVALEPGWNAIGNPFAFPVSVADIEFPAGVESLTAFDPSRGTTGDYMDRPVRLLQPFEGYFIYNGSSGPATLRVSPVEASAAELQVAARASTASPWYETRIPSARDSWVLRLQARSPHAVDGANLFGVHPDADDALDGFDRRKPPHSPGDWVQLVFPKIDWDSKSGLYRHDIRSPDADGHSWQVEVRSANRAEELVIEPLPAGSWPDDLSLRLLDRELGTVLDLRRSDGTLAAYRMLSHGPDRPYRLLLLAGTEAWVAEQDKEQTAIPTDLVLDRGSPNPFHVAARIRFGLPQPSPVNLVIYNVRGERVAWVVRNEQLPAGYHSRLWDGRDDVGRAVANGVYLCQLVTESKTLNKRLVRLK